MVRLLLLCFLVPIAVCATNPTNYEQLDTEQVSPITTHLSQVAKHNLQDALALLHHVDHTIEAPLRHFIHHEFLSHAHLMAYKVAQNGRIILIGAGSSGRIAIQLAAQFNAFLPVHAILAGGLDAFMRAKPGYEDSEEEGQKALANLKVTSNDLVILLSSSGSCLYNVGAGKLALQKQAAVIAFTNVTHPPAALADLVPKGLQAVSILTSPPAISGSTRLQSGRSLYMAIGLLLDATANILASPTPLPATQLQTRAFWHLQELEKIHQAIHSKLPSMTKLAHKVKTSLASGRYVTYIAIDALPDVLIDSTELAPTYSLPPLRNAIEAQGYTEPIRAFLVGAPNSFAAWESLCHCQLSEAEKQLLSPWHLGGKATMAQEICLSRPSRKNDLFIAALMPGEAEKNRSYLATLLGAAKTNGAATEWLDLNKQTPSVLAASVGMKEMLNLVSNGAMLELGKIYGNWMIDVVPSNQKLIARTVTIIRTLLKQHGDPASDSAIKQTIEEVLDFSKQYQGSKPLPSVAKIVITMLYKQLTIEQATAFLDANNQDLDSLF